MKITTLVENTACAPIDSAHGLSLYIETPKHRILFDAGPDGALLLRNAEALGIDLKTVDIAILSHGHYDHAGGLEAFFSVNDTAKLYLHRSAPEVHIALEPAGLRDISMDRTLCERFGDRMVFTDDLLHIDEELTLFSRVEGQELISASNGTLREMMDGKPVQDRFLHEQNLLIRTPQALALIAGCAHRGIVNILNAAQALEGRAPDAVFAGFHLTNPGRNTSEADAFVNSVGTALLAFPCRYSTGHCTGLQPYGVLKAQLGERLDYLAGGAVFSL